MKLFAEACRYASIKHRDQRRKSAQPAPYVNHVIDVAARLAESRFGDDEVLLVAALLHDIVEDTDGTRDDIAARFGEDVASVVMEVTDDKALDKAERKRLQIETAPHKSQRAKLIKIADLTSNVHSIGTEPPEGWDHRRKLDYVAWASAVIATCRGLDEGLDARFDEAAETVAAQCRGDG